jgi:hypothetical protein
MVSVWLLVLCWLCCLCAVVEESTVSQRDLDGTISKFMVRYKYPSFGVQLMVHFTIRHGNALSRQ